MIENIALRHASGIEAHLAEMTPAFYLNSYAPLVTSPAGRAASQRYNIRPFVDGSIRREPDLEHEYPSISCLCRAGKFAPRLQVGDVVAYVTRKTNYGRGGVERRLTAVLRVAHRFPGHMAAAEWYLSKDLPLPSNCWVRGNPAKPLVQSHRLHGISKACGAGGTHRAWDLGYRMRAMKYGTFIVCEALYRNLNWSAPEVYDEQLISAFGAIPGTQNPGRWTMEYGRNFLRQLGIEALF